MKFWADFHTHTRFSHGKGTLEDNVREAACKGLKAVGISDHGPASLWIGVNRDALQTVLAEKERCQRLFPQVKVLLGMETNIVSLKGDIDLPREWEQRIDYLLVGLHPRIMPKDLRMALLLIGNFLYRNAPFLLLRQWEKQIRKLNTNALSLAVERHNVLAVTHPGYGLPVDTPRLAAHCCARGTALEINNRHACETVSFIKAAAGAGVWFIVSSDAHDAKDVGVFDAAEEVIEKLSLPSSQIINAV